MLLFAPKEIHPGETRTALIPTNVQRLLPLGITIEVESGLGLASGIRDEDFTAAGAKVVTDRRQSLSAADIVLRVRKPPETELPLMKKGVLHVSYLDPFNEGPLVKALAAAGITAVSMEMIPRTTLAQKMDALSSQANIAGYISVIIAAERLGKILPMMTTPAGTIRPSKVFVIGVGVAGLQAIATAKRLGAQVEAFDTRPVVEEQVKSLGAKFVKIDLGETGQTAQGYAKELTPEQIEKQKQGMASHCAASDIVITTAQVFGRPAPRLLSTDMVAGMVRGSVVVDMAVETGGNVEGSRVNEVVDVNGVQLVGLGNLPGRVARTASEMYSSNLRNFVDHFWNKETKTFGLDLTNEILKGCVITHGGEVVNETIRQRLGGA